VAFRSLPKRPTAKQIGGVVAAAEAAEAEAEADCPPSENDDSSDAED